MVSELGRNRRRLLDRDEKAESGNKQTLSGGNRGLPDGQAANIIVLLRLFGPISRQVRFRAEADGHRQPLFWPVKRNAGRGCSTGNAG